MILTSLNIVEAILFLNASTETTVLTYCEGTDSYQFSDNYSRLSNLLNELFIGDFTMYLTTSDIPDSSRRSLIFTGRNSAPFTAPIIEIVLTFSDFFEWETSLFRGSLIVSYYNRKGRGPSIIINSVFFYSSLDLLVYPFFVDSHLGQIKITKETCDSTINYNTSLGPVRKIESLFPGIFQKISETTNTFEHFYSKRDIFNESYLDVQMVYHDLSCNLLVEEMCDFTPSFDDAFLLVTYFENDKVINVYYDTFLDDYRILIFPIINSCEFDCASYPPGDYIVVSQIVNGFTIFNFSIFVGDSQTSNQDAITSALERLFDIINYDEFEFGIPVQIGPLTYLIEFKSCKNLGNSINYSSFISETVCNQYDKTTLLTPNSYQIFSQNYSEVYRSLLSTEVRSLRLYKLPIDIPSNKYDVIDSTSFVLFDYYKNIRKWTNSVDFDKTDDLLYSQQSNSFNNRFELRNVMDDPTSRLIDSRYNNPGENNWIETSFIARRYIPVDSNGNWDPLSHDFQSCLYHVTRLRALGQSKSTLPKTYPPNLPIGSRQLWRFANTGSQIYHIFTESLLFNMRADTNFGFFDGEYCDTRDNIDIMMYSGTGGFPPFDYSDELNFLDKVTILDRIDPSIDNSHYIQEEDPWSDIFPGGKSDNLRVTSLNFHISRKASDFVLKSKYLITFTEIIGSQEFKSYLIYNDSDDNNQNPPSITREDIPLDDENLYFRTLIDVSYSDQNDMEFIITKVSRNSRVLYDTYKKYYINGIHEPRLDNSDDVSYQLLYTYYGI